MPLAATHVLLTIIIVDLFRDYVIKNKSKYFTLHTILIAGIAGLLPDVDVPLNWVLKFFGYDVTLLAHGGFTHTILIGLIFLVLGVILFKKGKHKWSTYSYVICFGLFFHIFLDYMLGGGGYNGPMLLWPISAQRYSFGFLHKLNEPNIFISLDAIILILWLWHEEVKHKIQDFI